MNNVINGTVFKFVLIGKIKGLAIESKRARNKLLKSKTIIKRQYFTNIKDYIGDSARHHLLAYAYMRGDNYFSIEKNCRANNKPNPDYLLKIIKQHSNAECNLESINSWLNFN